MITIQGYVLSRSHFLVLFCLSEFSIIKSITSHLMFWVMVVAAERDVTGPTWDITPRESLGDWSGHLAGTGIWAKCTTSAHLLDVIVCSGVSISGTRTSRETHAMQSCSKTLLRATTSSIALATIGLTWAVKLATTASIVCSRVLLLLCSINIESAWPIWVGMSLKLITAWISSSASTVWVWGGGRWRGTASRRIELTALDTMTVCASSAYW